MRPPKNRPRKRPSPRRGPPPDDSQDQEDREEEPQVWRPRFTLMFIMLVALVVCVMAAIASYMVNAIQDGAITDQGLYMQFIIASLAGPPILVVILALVRQVYFYFNRRD